MGENVAITGGLRRTGVEAASSLWPMSPAYAALGHDERRRVDSAILSLVEELASDGKISLHSPVLLGIGTRA